MRYVGRQPYFHMREQVSYHDTARQYDVRETIPPKRHFNEQSDSRMLFSKLVAHVMESVLPSIT